ncbi:MAG: leucine-rich repeat domain-containing protein [Clostridia bacterium]|nr:leucine-rich repeat domain-containing protein [Clostridia bacterium]
MKMKTMLKILSVICAVLLALPAFSSLSATETEGVCGPSLRWKYKDAVLTISGEGPMYDYTRISPSALSTEPPWRYYSNSAARLVIEEGCTYIGENAFSRLETVSEIKFPENSLKELGEHSFSFMTNLRYAVLPDSIESISASAFSGCTALKYMKIGTGLETIPQSFCSDCRVLKTLIIPDNCKTILEYAFKSCSSLRELNISHIERIDSLAFQACPLTTVSFGSELKYMDSYAFSDCLSLSKVYFADDTDPIRVSNLFLGNTAYYSALSDGVYTMFNGKVLMCKGKYSGQTLTVPEGVTMIADHAFSGSTGLSSVNLPSSLESIGAFAFRDCSKLNSIYVPPTVTYLGENCLGKRAADMTYYNVDVFTIYGKGACAAEEYACAEGLDYVCRHKFSTVFSSSNCSEGVMRRRICDYCGCCIERELLPTAEHTYNAEVIPATCTDDGYTLLTCSVCGATDITDRVPAFGHIASDEWTVVQMGGCGCRGLAARLCTVCGAPAETIPLEKKTHTPSADYSRIVDPSCTEEGADAILCTVCGEAVSVKAVPKLEHIPSSEPRILNLPAEDDTVYGCRVYVCTVCGYVTRTEWFDSEGALVDPNGAYGAALYALNNAMISPITSFYAANIDFFPDGEIDSKDVITLRKFAETGSVPQY